MLDQVQTLDTFLESVSNLDFDYAESRVRNWIEENKNKPSDTPFPMFGKLIEFISFGNPRRIKLDSVNSTLLFPNNLDNEILKKILEIVAVHRLYKNSKYILFWVNFDNQICLLYNYNDWGVYHNCFIVETSEIESCNIGDIQGGNLLKHYILANSSTALIYFKICNINLAHILHSERGKWFFEQYVKAIEKTKQAEI